MPLHQKSEIRKCFGVERAYEHLHRAGLFAIFGHITNTRVIFWLALPIQKLSGDELFEGAPTAQIYSIR
jgi:hypothetical protein